MPVAPGRQAGRVSARRARIGAAHARWWRPAFLRAPSDLRVRDFVPPAAPAWSRGSCLGASSAHLPRNLTPAGSTRSRGFGTAAFSPRPWGERLPGPGPARSGLEHVGAVALSAEPGRQARARGCAREAWAPCGQGARCEGAGLRHPGSRARSGGQAVPLPCSGEPQGDRE